MNVSGVDGTAALCVDVLAGDPAAFLAGQEDHDGSHVLVGIADSGSGGLPLERSSSIAGHYLSKFPFVDSIEGFVDTTNELMQVFAQEVHRH